MKSSRQDIKRETRTESSAESFIKVPRSYNPDMYRTKGRGIEQELKLVLYLVASG
jgi:hypothetical protein